MTQRPLPPASDVHTLVRSWRTGGRVVTLSALREAHGSAPRVSVSWNPREPRYLTSRQLERHRHQQRAALASIADELGVDVAVLDV